MEQYGLEERMWTIERNVCSSCCFPPFPAWVRDFVESTWSVTLLTIFQARALINRTIKG